MSALLFPSASSPPPPCPRGLTFTWWGCCGLCLWHKSTDSPTQFYSVLVSVSVFLALSAAFHSINSPDNSLHFLILFFRSYFCFTGPFNLGSKHQLINYLFLKVSLSLDIILCGWLGLKHQLTAPPPPLYWKERVRELCVSWIMNSSFTSDEVMCFWPWCDYRNKDYNSNYSLWSRLTGRKISSNSVMDSCPSRYHVKKNYHFLILLFIRVFIYFGESAGQNMTTMTLPASLSSDNSRGERLERQQAIDDKAWTLLNYERCR